MALLGITGHSTKHGNHGTIPNTISRVRNFISPFLNTAFVHNAAEVGCYFVTKISFEQAGIMCTKIVICHTTHVFNLATFSFRLWLCNS
jgi:hypothetical protein